MENLPGLYQFATGIGIENIRAGYTFKDPTMPSRNIRVERYWFCEVYSSLYGDALSHESLLVGVLYTNLWQRGLLVLPSMFSNYTYGQIPNPFKSINLIGWHDPVHETLKDISVFPKDEAVIDVKAKLYEYTLEFYTSNCKGELRIMGPSQNSKLKNLWSALDKTVKEFANIYEDDIFIKYINRKQYK